MRGDTASEPTLWIQPQDRTGKAIDRELMDAAHRNWRRIVSYARRQGQDSSRAAEELERAVHSLSALFDRHPRFRDRIRNFDDYVFWVTAHRLNRCAARQPTVEYVGALEDLNVLQRAQDSDWVSRLEDELFLKEIIGNMSERTRYLFHLRQMGRSWHDIAKILGITANAAQVQFNRGLTRARKRILRRAYFRKDRTPEAGRPRQ
jgi:RNA polymerase sigma factor (sigma-70 family)